MLIHETKLTEKQPTIDALLSSAPNQVTILPSEDKNNTIIQAPSSFVDEFLKENAPKVDKMPFIVYKELLIQMRKKYAGYV
ncbi:hypothetical protein HZS_1899 [Henneguya salminicola]|nr:hypothetical protein HZS_1899 [Henneguya salminicola]